MNKEVVGLEDQLSLVPGKGETSDLERFKQVLNICVRNTCRYTNDPLTLASHLLLFVISLDYELREHLFLFKLKNKEGAVSFKNGKSSHLVQHLYIFH